MKTIVDALSEHDVIVGTTGMLSRELFEYRVAKGQGHEKDFLTVGSMGHASAIALGIAQFRPKRQVGIFSFLNFIVVFQKEVRSKFYFQSGYSIHEKSLLEQVWNKYLYKCILEILGKHNNYYYFIFS